LRSPWRAAGRLRRSDPRRGRFRSQYHGLTLLRRRGSRPHPVLLLLDPALIAIEAPHAILAACLDHIGDLTELAGAYGSFRRNVREQYLATRDAQLLRFEKLQTLTDGADQAIGQLSADAALYLSRKGHADPRECLDAGGRM